VDNICTIQKVTLHNEENENGIPGFQIVTVAGGMNFTFKTEKERDEKFDELFFKLS
jgi:hypothetical protein